MESGVLPTRETPMRMISALGRSSTTLAVVVGHGKFDGLDAVEVGLVQLAIEAGLAEGQNAQLAAQVFEQRAGEVEGHDAGARGFDGEQVAAVLVDHRVENDGAGDAGRACHDAMNLFGAQDVGLDVQRHADVRELRQHCARQQFAGGAGAARDYEDGRALFEGDYMIVVVADCHKLRPLAEKRMVV